MRSMFVATLSLGVAFAVGCGSEAQVVAGCDNDALASGCTVGRCRITSSTRPLPAGAVLALEERPVPAELSADVLGPSLCHVELPAGTAASDLNLTVDAGARPPSDAILFEHSSSGATPVTPSVVLSQQVLAVVRRSGTYGATRLLGPWSVVGRRGEEISRSNDTGSLLRNLAGNVTTAAFFDGTRLFVANGNRVLVYAGLPRSAGDRPAFVLGQPDLDGTLTTTTASTFTSPASGVWSDGRRLVVSHGHRVLVWQSMPTQSLTPADLVLGQQDFASNQPNSGGISASSFFSATGVDSDGERLVVADALNHRVLQWSAFPTSTGQPADVVIGQPDFHSNTALSGATKLYIPYGALAGAQGVYVASVGGPGLALASPVFNNAPATPIFGWQFAGVEPGTQVSRPGYIARTITGGVAVRDTGLARINLTQKAPTQVAFADITLGQPDPTRMVGLRWENEAYVHPARVNASTFGAYPGVSGGSGALLVPDHKRLLVWERFPTYHYEPASFVVGQPGFATNDRDDFRTVAAHTLAVPADVAIAGPVAAIADKGNNRVLLFDTAALGKRGAPAFAVVGQLDASSYVANLDLRTPSKTTLSGPEGVCLDGLHLVVADTENHRVLVWNRVPTRSGTPADFVLGQADFTGTRPNRGRGDQSPRDGYSDAAADGFFYPTGVACDGAHLAVADRLNHRVLVWSKFPTSGGQAPDRLLGQADFSHVLANRNAGWASVAPDGLNMPTGVTFSGSSLWVADTENNRVVRYDDVFGAPMPSVVLGQPDASTVTHWNYQRDAGVYTGNPPSVPHPTTAASMLRPRAVHLTQGKVFVSESDSNRVHMFDATTRAHAGVLGQPSDTGDQPNFEGIQASGLSEPLGLASDGTRLFVVDGRNHRVVGYDRFTTGAAAGFFVGQPAPAANGFNQSTTAAGGVTAQPRALALLGDALYVADAGNSRVLVVDPKQSPWAVTRVLGQPDDKVALPNSGLDTSAQSMSGPRGLAVDERRLVVADTGNNRVLVFDPRLPSSDAGLVLGQPDFAGSAVNAGGPSARAMAAPAGVCTDGERLVVTDTGNHRALVWSTFPTRNQQPADVVIGQADMTSVSPNRGSGAASASSLSFPGACVFDGGALYIADTGNNRVLRFAAVPTGSGAPASAVLGQPDAVARVPSAAVFDRSRLAGPAALATDGHNLYVVDRDLARVVVFRRDELGAFSVASEVIGGSGGTSPLRGSGGIAVRRTPYFTSELYTSETSDSRVAHVVSVSRLATNR